VYGLIECRHRYLILVSGYWHSEVAQTQFGYHIIRLEDRRGGDTAPVEEVADKIRAYLGQQKLQSEVETLVMTLRNGGKVESFVNL